MFILLNQFLIVLIFSCWNLCQIMSFLTFKKKLSEYSHELTLMLILINCMPNLLRQYLIPEIGMNQIQRDLWSWPNKDNLFQQTISNPICEIQPDYKLSSQYWKHWLNLVRANGSTILKSTEINRNLGTIQVKTMNDSNEHFRQLSDTMCQVSIVNLKLNHINDFTLIFHFYTLWKRLKTRDIEIQHWRVLAWNGLRKCFW